MPPAPAISANWTLPPDTLWRTGPTVLVTLGHPRTGLSVGKLRAVLDTGSPYTLADPNLIQTLGLAEVVPPEIAYLKPIGGAAQRNESIRAAAMLLEGTRIPAFPIKVAADNLKAVDPTLDVLIGRDTLAKLQFVYDGPAASFTLLFQPTP